MPDHLGCHVRRFQRRFAVARRSWKSKRMPGHCAEDIRPGHVVFNDHHPVHVVFNAPSDHMPLAERIHPG